VINAQTYTDQTAIDRMRRNLCPECGHPVEDHGGWGGLDDCVCGLTDNGVAQRIARQFEMDASSEELSNDA
jgi:hypothetical protein